MKIGEVNFKGEVLDIEKACYGEGNVAIRIGNEYEPYAILSVNIVDLELEPNEFAVKNYSENEEIYNFIKETGIFEDTGKTAQTGFVTVPIWELKEELK